MLLRFALFLNEIRNAMLLQESEKVNISRDVEHKLDFNEFHDGSRERNSEY